MAYAALVSLTQTIDILLHEYDQYSISLHEKQQIISIYEYIIFLQAFLEYFPEKANSLEGQIRDVAYQAEDIIEEFILEHIRPHHISEPQSVMFMCLKKKKRQHFDFQELIKVTAEIDSIARVVMEIKSSAGSTDDSCVAASSSARLIIAPTSSDIAMVGLEDDLLEIKARLCGESSKLEVIPIYGMGGIGKTTLARNAYEDPLIVEHFHIRAWVTISQDYSATPILSKLLVSVGAKCSEENDESKIAENVYKSLKGRRYLIVTDDMWSTKVWDDMRRIFPDDNNGSRIILTTRLSYVAAYPKSSNQLHEMHFMDPDQSWNLLHQKVFKQEICPPELECIGKVIARRCKGLPLAIIVIAGVLSTVNKTRAAWERIAKDINEAVTKNDEYFADTLLSLSYNHLPQHLKPCFLYMGGFPEDYEIRVSKLIKLWVAEGFLKLPNGSKICEEVAEDYLEDLVKRSLILVNRRKSNGKIKSCSVHDLVRNLCTRKAQEEKFFKLVTEWPAHKIHPKSLKDQLRLSFPHYIEGYVFHRKIYGPTSVRTVLFFQQCENLSIIPQNFRLLRVLDGVKIIFTEFPFEVLELFHLRYLAFTFRGHYLYVPPSISKLENLQFLFISSYFGISNGIHCPLEIWRMSQLRHLEIFQLELPYPNCALENLQTLSQVKNFRCTVRSVQMIPNLKKLGILYNGEYATKWHIYELHNLVQMHQLQALKIRIEDLGSPTCSLKNLAFPPMLKKLNLSGFEFGGQDIATVGSLPNLQVLKLRFCGFKEQEWKTSEGEFHKLKFLLIDVTNLKEWMTESSHFPSLKCLVLRSCYFLDEIPDGFGEVPTLELIEIDDTKESLVESAKRIQEEQQSFGNDTLQVRVVHRWQSKDRAEKFVRAAHRWQRKGRAD